MDKRKKSQDLSVYFKLKNQENLIEKSFLTLLTNSKIHAETARSLKNEFDQYESERRELVKSLNEEVRDIYEELKRVKNMIHPENVEKIDLEVFKTKLQTLWKRIQDFKASLSPIDELQEKQKTLNSELDCMIKVILKQKNFVVGNNSTCKSVKSQKNGRKEESNWKVCDYDNVEDFCTLLAKTGHNGNWSEEDHLLFLRLRQKHGGKSIAQLVHVIQAKCPDLSREAIVNHEAWYRKYLQLRDKQREAVQKWRQSKQELRSKFVTLATINNDNNCDIVKNDKAKSPMQTLVQDAPASSITTNRYARPNSGKESINKPPDHLLRVAEHKKEEIERKKALVKRWKDQRDRIKLEEEHRLKNQMKANKDAEEAKRTKLKQALEEYKQRRIAESAASPREQDRNVVDCSHKSSSGDALQLYRAKDQEYLERRRNALLKITPSKASNSCTASALTGSVSCKVYQTNLLNDAEAWQEKIDLSPYRKPRRSSSSLSSRLVPCSWKSFDFPSSISYGQK